MEELQENKTFMGRLFGEGKSAVNRRKFLEKAGMATAIGGTMLTIACKKRRRRHGIAHGG